jgi:SAM-dependent methyltransferase
MAQDHCHGHDEFDWSASAAQLAAWDHVWAPTYRDVAAWLGVSDGARVADVGSGAGGFAAALAERVGAAGQVTLIDGDERLLDVARSNQPPGIHVRAVHADLEGAPVGAQLADRFDVVHAGNVIHHTDDQQRTIGLLAQLLRPGGRLVLTEGGLTPRFLPRDCGLGEPDLEARLDAATSRWFWSHVRPAGATVAMPHGWGVALGATGLADVCSRSFLLDIPPPLGAIERSLVAQALADAASRAGEWLTDEDRAGVAALVDPDRPESVHQRPDVFILAARTFHVARLPG